MQGNGKVKEYTYGVKMFENIRAALESWNNNSSERQKLQHTYLVLATITVFGAGLVSLVNAELGHNIVTIALLAVIIFFANAIVWNLLQSSLLSRLSKRPRKK